MAEIPFSTAGDVVLDVNGDGRVVLGPNVGQHWTIAVASVHASPAVKVPQCSIYMGSGSPIASEFVDGTFTGNLDSTDRTSAVPLNPGQKILAEWLGGDPGATATLSIQGTNST